MRQWLTAVLKKIALSIAVMLVVTTLASPQALAQGITDAQVRSMNVQLDDPSFARLESNGAVYDWFSSSGAVPYFIWCCPVPIGSAKAEAKVGTLHAQASALNWSDDNIWSAQAFFQDTFTVGGIPAGTPVLISAAILKLSGDLVIAHSDITGRSTRAEASGLIVVTFPGPCFNGTCGVFAKEYIDSSVNGLSQHIDESLTTSSFPVGAGTSFTVKGILGVAATGTMPPDELTNLPAAADFWDTAKLNFDMSGLPPGAFITSSDGTYVQKAEAPADTTPPTTTAATTPTPNANGWNNINVTVALTATDNTGGSGVKQVTFSVTGAQAIPATIVPGSSASLLITAEGVSTVTFFSTDSAGNSEAPQTLTIRIDKTPPTLTPSRSPSANRYGWNNTDVTVSFACADSLSGLASCDPTPQIVVAEGANQSATATATDLAGNTASATVGGINIDKTPPIMTCAVSPNVLWPPTHKLVAVNNTIQVSDALSGAAGFLLLSIASNEPDSGRGDIVGWTVGTPSNSGELGAERLGTSTDRVYTFIYQGSDRADNVATCAPTATVPHDQGNH